MTCEPLAGWRHVAVTGRRTMTDFAHQMRFETIKIIGIDLYLVAP